MAYTRNFTEFCKEHKLERNNDTFQMYQEGLEETPREIIIRQYNQKAKERAN